MRIDNFNNAFRRDLISLIPLISKWKTNYTLAELFFETEWAWYEDQEFVVFDTETNWFRDEIIEIWAIIVKNNMIKHKDWSFHPYEYYISNNKQHFNEMDSFPYFVLPSSWFIPDKIMELTHINMDLIEAGRKEDAPYGTQTIDTFVDAFNAFIDYIWDRPIIAHNAWFDTWIFKWSINFFYHQLDSAVKDINHPLTLDKIQHFFQLKVIDTYGEASRALTLNPNLNHQNGVLSAFFWLPPQRDLLHRAIYDVIFTARNFYWLYEEIWNTYERLKTK